jgi:uncharacterized protein (TIGR02246 family)
MIDTSRIDGWLARYRNAWASDDPELIAGLFTDDVRYFTAPYRDAIAGREAVLAWWRAEKESEIPWSFDYEVIAREGDRFVVSGITRYPKGEDGESLAQVYRNLWLVSVDSEGRASEFIEYWMLVE